MKLWKILLFSLLAAIGIFILYMSAGRKSQILSRQSVVEKYRLPESRFLNWNGTEVHYTDAGQGPVVLMIHGLGGSCYDFATLDTLMRGEYRVIRVDLPGFGLSDFPPQPTDTPDFPEVYLDFFNYFLDTLHVDSLFVIGNSMGGMMAWYLAVHEPGKVKKLVLLNSAGYDLENVVKHVTKRSSSKWVQRLVRRGIPKYMTEVGLKGVFYDKSKLTQAKIDRVNDFWNTEGHMQVIFGLASTKKFPDSALIRQIQCPTLILWGKQDALVSPEHAERFHHDISRSRVIVYDSCGHVPQMERLSDVYRDVSQFFAE